jgi:hypothetical protein
VLYHPGCPKRGGLINRDGLARLAEQPLPAVAREQGRRRIGDDRRADCRLAPLDTRSMGSRRLTPVRRRPAARQRERLRAASVRRRHRRDHQVRLRVRPCQRNVRARRRGHRVQPSRLRAIDTVYAMTIHRSQGSQFDSAAVLLPDPVPGSSAASCCTRQSPGRGGSSSLPVPRSGFGWPSAGSWREHQGWVDACGGDRFVISRSVRSPSDPDDMSVRPHTPGARAGQPTFLERPPVTADSNAPSALRSPARLAA